ncbi:hypothetical protein ABC974_14450 [Sphingomonas oligophenolica]|uniref:Uncharacterized protein n=1 Tax=Sphingomonas oligophenolica TaxID=301154 RepID=A0ABU9Y4U5_9SPHN
MDTDFMAAAGDRPGAVTPSDTIGFPMGQLRTANKRRNRALDRAAAKPAKAAAPVKTAKSRTAKSAAS